MSPRSRLRLSVESSRSDRELADSQQFYQYTQHSPNTNKVFIDSKGQPHDPDFMSHMFPDQSAYKKRRMEAERARRASMGRHDDDHDDYNSDDELMSSGSASNDPFRARSTYSYYPAQPARNNYSSSYGSSSYSTPTPSWQHTALLDDADDADDISPTSERFSIRGWRKRSQAVDCSDDAWDTTEKNRNVLRRRRRDLEELEEDDDENMVRESEGNDAEDCAPTCTQALKQSWQGFLLRYKLGTHRLKRRIFPRKPEQVSTSPYSMEEKYILGGT
ncbi:hypothetical protein FRC01_008238 [Tulasnella sp. 417]|nr:hypothetical protein FRC01_008238 [Tulasnella sp. 417]